MKKINYSDELKKIQVYLENDPGALWPILFRLRTPLYKQLVEDAQAHSDQPLAHRIVDILSDHYRLLETGGLELDRRSADVLAAICRTIGKSPKEALKLIVEKAAVAVLKEVHSEEQDRQAVLKFKQK